MLTVRLRTGWTWTSPFATVGRSYGFAAKRNLPKSPYAPAAQAAATFEALLRPSCSQMKFPAATTLSRSTPV